MSEIMKSTKIISKDKIKLLAITLLLLLLYLINPDIAENLNTKVPPSPSPSAIEIKGLKDKTQPQTTTTVKRVIDGDTIELEQEFKVRLIGIDTPESRHPQKPKECYAKEATTKLKELIEGKTIQMEKDVSETDRYGRLLRYIFLNDIFINELMVKQGYAHARSYPPDIKYQEILKQAEQHAKDYNLGLWSFCPLPSPSPSLSP